MHLDAHKTESKDGKGTLGDFMMIPPFWLGPAWLLPKWAPVLFAFGYDPS